MTLHERQLKRTLLATAISLSLLTLAGCSNGSNATPDTGASITPPPTPPTPPTVTTTTPAADDNHIATTSNLEATFSKSLLLTSVDATQFTLSRNGVLVPAQVNFDGTTAILNPDDDLLASAHYNASLNSGIVDNDGNALTTLQWAFITDGNGWSLDEQIETDNAGDADMPQISVDASGNAIAVWAQHDGTRANIHANRYTASTNSWGTAALIETDNAGYADYPQISVDTNGNAVAVWSQSDGTRYNMMANQYNSATDSWGTAALIETDNAGGGASSPQISVDANGNAVAVWVQSDATHDNIMANRYNASTNSWGTAALIETDNTGDASDPQISVDASGNAFAVWHQGDGTHDNIMANRYTASTDSWGTAALIESDDTGDASNPQISIDASGNAIAVWAQNLDIIANRYTTSTGTWGAVALIETVEPAGIPQISVDASGNAFAVWVQHDGTRINIHSSHFDQSVVAP